MCVLENEADELRPPASPDEGHDVRVAEAATRRPSKKVSVSVLEEFIVEGGRGGQHIPAREQNF